MLWLDAIHALCKMQWLAEVFSVPDLLLEASGCTHLFELLQNLFSCIGVLTNVYRYASVMVGS